jgi:hypothetical protein
MQHALYFDVVYELEPARHHVAHVDARHRRAEHRPLARVAALRVRIERDLEFPAADELGVGRAV